ncbi:hypothetical protein [Kiloniella majae]|uniref:hypothetical protein n=1 Tax=Kiloniella majae TaxID=1938558 RepID=UPI0015C510BB|nr:hypothetical protein [Kiloniella majae]
MLKLVWSWSGLKFVDCTISPDILDFPDPQSALIAVYYGVLFAQEYIKNFMAVYWDRKLAFIYRLFSGMA